jgi:hypothetical protein
MRALRVALLAGMCVQAAFAAQTIVTYAGGGPARGAGLATEVSLFSPNGIAVDGAGNLYIADTENNRICRVDAATRQLTVLAGTGVAGFQDGPGAQAQFSNPTDIAIDSAGNAYVTDAFNQLVRKIAPDGTVSSLVGVSDAANGFVVPIEFQLISPVGVYVDSADNLYICDESLSTVYKTSLNGGTALQAIAGNGTGGFSGDGGAATAAMLNAPRRVAVDAAGNVLIVDAFNFRIRKVDTGGTITTLVGDGNEGFSGDGGPATAANLDLPTSLALDGAGNLYLSDSNNYRIRKVDAGGTITTIAGTGFDGFGGDGGDPLNSTFVFVLAMARDAAGNLFIADTFGNRIREIGDGLTTAYDSDGDGFPDHVETAALTDPMNAASTPFSNQPLTQFDGHGLQKATIKLNFAKANSDSIQFSGILPIPDGVSVATQPLIVDFGGIAAAFSLDLHGKSTPKGNNSFKLGVKPKDGVSKYTCKLTKGSFAMRLGDDNLLNATVTGENHAIPVTIYFANTSFTHNAFTVYKSSANKSGQAKTGNNAFVPGQTQSLQPTPGRGGKS